MVPRKGATKKLSCCSQAAASLLLHVRKVQISPNARFNVWIRLCAGFRFRGTFHLTRLRWLDVVRGDPVGIIGCRGGDSRGGIGSRVNAFKLLGAASLFIEALALALLREVRCDPNTVDEIGDPSEESENKKVEEDAIVQYKSAIHSVGGMGTLVN
jgi:hypothetical protein